VKNGRCSDGPDDAFDRVRGTAGKPIVPRLGQSVLDELLADLKVSSRTES